MLKDPISLLKTPASLLKTPASLLKAPIGLLGGTFDPIHIGHLRPAIEARDAIGLAEVRLIPNHIPPHRANPFCSSEQRLAMVKLAAAETATLW